MDVRRLPWACWCRGAGGGVSSIAIQLLKLHQVEVTGVDSAAKLEAMRLWGYDHLIDYASQDFTRSGKCYDLIIDVTTDRSPADYERALNPNGFYATVGREIRRLLQVALSRFRFRRADDRTLRVVNLKANRDLDHFNELFEAGNFKPVIDSEYAFNESDVQKAFQRFGAAAHTGKIVVRIE